MAEDIKDTKELVTLVAVLAKAFKDAQADGRIDATDIAVLIQVIPSLTPALENITNIPAELKDLDAAEVQELADAVKVVVGELGDAKYAEVAERAVKAGLAIFEIVKILKADDDVE